ncbi:hypothetical protein JYT44_03050 [Caldithrix abyssi]|nr:hypothetical protein [Caldithrix abyssi]
MKNDMKTFDRELIDLSPIADDWLHLEKGRNNILRIKHGIEDQMLQNIDKEKALVIFCNLVDKLSDDQKVVYCLEHRVLLKHLAPKIKRIFKQRGHIFDPTIDYSHRKIADILNIKPNKVSKIKAVANNKVMNEMYHVIPVFKSIPKFLDLKSRLSKKRGENFTLARNLLDKPPLTNEDALGVVISSFIDSLKSNNLTLRRESLNYLALLHQNFPDTELWIEPSRELRNLIHLRIPEELDHIHGLVFHDIHFYYVQAVIEAMSIVRECSTEILELLIGCLYLPDESYPFRIVEALRIIDFPDKVQIIADLLHAEEEPIVRSYFANALAAIGTAESLSALTKFLLIHQIPKNEMNLLNFQMQVSSEISIAKEPENLKIALKQINTTGSLERYFILRILYRTGEPLGNIMANVTPHLQEWFHYAWFSIDLMESSGNSDFQRPLIKYLQDEKNYFYTVLRKSELNLADIQSLDQKELISYFIDYSQRMDCPAGFFNHIKSLAHLNKIDEINEILINCFSSGSFKDYSFNYDQFEVMATILARLKPNGLIKPLQMIDISLQSRLENLRGENKVLLRQTILQKNGVDRTLFLLNGYRSFNRS